MKFFSPKVQKILLDLPKNFTVSELLTVVLKELGHPAPTVDLTGINEKANLAKLTSNSTFVTLQSIYDELLKDPRISVELQKISKRSDIPKPTPFLDAFSADMTKMAEDGLLDPVIGRETELSRMITILMRKKKNNVIITGKAGVGKTALVELLAQRIVENKVPPQLANKRVLSINVNNLIADQRIRGEIEARLERIITEICESNVIVFFDEIHQLVGGHNVEISQALKPYLTGGRFRCIGATTRDEYGRYFMRDEAFKRRFQVIDLAETTFDETHKILQALSGIYGAYHQVKVSDDLLKDIISLCERYVDGVFPDKAIDILDELCTSIEISAIPESKTNPRKLLRERRFAEFIKLNPNNNPRNTIEATKENLFNVIKVATKVNEVTSIDMKSLTNSMQLSTFGQDKAISDICSYIAMQGNVYRTSGCAASLIFSGPEGCGKRHTARSLARVLYGQEKDHFLYINIESYADRSQAFRLIGAPPGYIGHETGGTLTKFIRDNPNCIIYLENIEAGIDSIKSIFHEMIQEGRIQDSMGQIIDCRNCVVIGGHPELKSRVLGFVPVSEPSIVNPELQFFGKIIGFNKLEKEDLKKVCLNIIESHKGNLAKRSIELIVDSNVAEYILDQSKTPAEIENIINSQIVDNLKFGDRSAHFILKSNKIEKETCPSEDPA